MTLPRMPRSPAWGAYADVVAAGLAGDFEDWLECEEDAVRRQESGDWRWARDRRALIGEPDLAALTYTAERAQRAEETGMAKVVRKGGAAATAAAAGTTLALPTERNAPSGDLWQFAYLLTGEKKIGKTTFAIEECEEFVMQFDKPQIAYSIREMMVRSWPESTRIIAALEDLVKRGEFPYQRVVVDGAGEWYTMCQLAVCKHFGVQHPSDEGYARAWHKLRDDFTDAVNRLLRLQATAGCGLVFIAHSEWREKKTRGGEKIERLVPNLPPKCEEILNGKCDGWFTMDYVGDQRVLILLGDETTGAGHRIDGHFTTPGGQRVREVPMGDSSAEALANFRAAFENRWEWTTYKEWRDGAGTAARPSSRKAVVRRK